MRLAALPPGFQSIYAFRGANVGNMVSAFQRDFPGSQVGGAHLLAKFLVMHPLTTE